MLAYKDERFLLATHHQLQQDLTYAGLIIAPENIKKEPCFQYLGHVLYTKEIKPQKSEIRKDGLKTLNDFQKLLGGIQWLRPYLKFSTGDLAPLSEILKGDGDPNSPRQLTEQGGWFSYRMKMLLKNSRSIMLIIINLGKHLFCQDLPLQQYLAKQPSFTFTSSCFTS